MPSETKTLSIYVLFVRLVNDNTPVPELIVILPGETALLTLIKL